MKIELKAEKFMKFTEYLTLLDLSNNPMITSQLPGNWNNQIIPSVYFIVSDSIDYNSDFILKNDCKSSA